MKRLFLSIAIFCIILVTSAQVTQVGIVKEYNSNGKPVAGAGISILSSSDLQPAASNSDGFFRLNFSQKRTGDVVYNLRIVKDGYEIVNAKDFADGWTLSPQDTMKIIVAKKGIIAQTRAKYYDIIDQYKESEYRQTIASIKEKLDNQIITTEEYKTKMENAELRLRDAYTKIEEYADMFARINQDDLDSISQQALSFLLAGKINEAIVVFENHHLLDQFNQKVELRDRSQEAIQNLVPKLQEEIAYRQIAGGDDNLTKIDRIHKGIIQSDTSNFNYLFDYTSFLSSQNQLYEAALWDQKAIQHSKTDANKVDALQVMGEIFYKQNNDSASIEYLQKSLDIANVLKINAPYVYKRVVTYPLNTLGNLYIDQNEFDKAETLLKECAEIRKELFEVDSSYLSDYARALNNLGEMYRCSFEKGRDSASFINALHYFNEAITLSKKLVWNNSPVTESQLANTYNNKGALFIDRGFGDSAITYLSKANEIFERIYSRNPDYYGEYLINNINNLGLVYSKIKQYDKSKYYFDRGIAICKQMQDINYPRYKYKESILLINEGLLFKRMQQYEQTFKIYEEALNIRKSMNADKMDCAFDIYEVYNNYAVCYYTIKQYDSAIVYFNRCKNILNCLKVQHYCSYINHYLTVSYYIAYCYYVKKDYKSGIPAYKRCRKEILKARKSCSGRYEKLYADVEKEMKELKTMKKHKKQI